MEIEKVGPVRFEGRRSYHLCLSRYVIGKLTDATLPRCVNAHHRPIDRLERYAIDSFRNRFENRFEFLNETNEPD